MNINLTKNLYTIREAAQILSISPNTLRAYIFAGKLRAIKPGGKYLIASDTIAAFIRGEQPDVP